MTGLDFTLLKMSSAILKIWLIFYHGLLKAPDLDTLENLWVAQMNCGTDAEDREMQMMYGEFQEKFSTILPLFLLMNYLNFYLIGQKGSY